MWKSIVILSTSCEGYIKTYSFLFSFLLFFLQRIMRVLGLRRMLMMLPVRRQDARKKR
jgi:hypothetical protein